MPAQKAADDLWSHVYTIQLRTCLRFGAVSSMLVAFRILMASSPSDLNWQYQHTELLDGEIFNGV
jgi:hypothetical protein